MKTKLVFLYLFCRLKNKTKKKNQKIKKEPKLQIFKESIPTFRKYLAKLNLYSLSSLILIVTKFQVTPENCAGGYESCFNLFPEFFWFFCLGLINMGQEKTKSSVPSAREGRIYCILHSAHCSGQLVKFHIASNSISQEQLFIKGMDNSIDCYKFDWLNRQIGTVSPSLPAICFFLNIW